MKKALFCSVVFGLASTLLFADQPLVQTWDGSSEIVFTNNGDGTGTRVTLPVSLLDARKTLKFELVSGDFKSLTIYAITTEKEYFKVYEKYDDFPDALTPESMQSMATWKKPTATETFTDFLFTVNGDDDELDAYPAEIRMSVRAFSGEETHELAKTLKLVYMALYVAVLALMLVFFLKRTRAMINDRQVPSNKILKFIMAFGFGAFFVIIFISYIPPGFIGTISKAPRGFFNDMGSLMIMAVLADIAICLFFLRHVRYNRCPKCHHVGGIISLGAEYTGSHTTTTYTNGVATNRSTTRFFNDWRKCPECENIWAVQTVK